MSGTDKLIVLWVTDWVPEGVWATRGVFVR